MLSLTTTSNAKPETSVEQHSKLMSTSDRFPIVQGLGFSSKYMFFSTGLGFGLGLQADIYGGYQTDLFYLSSTSNYLVANPIFYLEAAIKA